MTDLQREYDEHAKAEEDRRAQSDYAVAPDSGIEVPVDKDGAAFGDTGHRDVTDPSTAPGVVVESPFVDKDDDGE